MTGSPPAAADELADPGRPRGKDELDPELVSLPRKRANLGPILCAAIVAFNLVLIQRLWLDLRFSRQGDEPVRATLADLSENPRESFVEIHAAPDRAYDLRVFASEAKAGSRLMPFLGSDGAAWLLLEGDPNRADAEGGETYRGRLKRIEDLPFSDALAESLAELEPIPRATTAAAVRAALAQPGSLRDASGDRVPVAAADAVVVHEAVPGKSSLVCYATDNHPDEATWRDALARAGVTDGPTPPITGSDQAWTYEIAALPDAVSIKLAAARLFSCQVEPLTRMWRASWSQLASSADGLMVNQIQVPWDHVTGIEVATRRDPPRAGTCVLVAGESPGDYWYVLPVVILLLGFALLFTWGLVRSVRALMAAPPAVG